jgi:hypothetical protein
MATDNFCFYLQNRLIQTSQTGGQWYSDTSPFSIPWTDTNLYCLFISDEENSLITLTPGLPDSVDSLLVAKRRPEKLRHPCNIVIEFNQGSFTEVEGSVQSSSSY